MSVIGTFTNIGIQKAIEAQNSEGFRIYPESFSVSNQESSPNDLSDLAELTSPNAGVWYTGTISTRVVIDNDTVQVFCTIPPNVPGVVFQEHIKEIYVFAKDINDNDFLLAVGKPDSTTLLYDKQGSTTLRLQFKLTNADLSEQFVFEFTQATEISEHNSDPNAHPDIRSNFEKAGIFEQAGQHEFIGQHFDEFANDGTHRTIDASVQNDDLVYLDTDNVYKRAVADGTNKSHVTGFVDKPRDQVYTNGLVKKQTVYPHGTLLYLHPTNPGQVTDTPNKYPVGMVFDDHNILLRVDHPLHVSNYINAVVSDQPGVRHFEDLQTAINASPAGGWVRVDKMYSLHGPDPITNNGKQVNILFSGVRSGIEKFLGVNEIQKIEFSDTPDSGSFVLIHEGNETSRLYYNSNATDIKNALESLASINSVSVSGNMTDGFTVEFTGVDEKTNFTQITVGTDPGVNEKQLIDFDNDDFDSGSFRLEFDGQLTGAIAFNEINALTIQTRLNNLSNLSGAIVTEVGSPPAGHTQFEVEFSGNDGKQDQNMITAPSGDNSLEDSSSTPIVITITEDTKGKLPDNTLLIGTTTVTGAGSTLQQGESIGSDTGVFLDSPGCQLVGLGKIKGFGLGIDLNEQPTSRIEMFFESNTTPIDYSNLNLDEFSLDGSVGIDLTGSAIEESLFRSLVRVDPKTPPDKTAIVTPAEVSLSDGSKHGLVIDQRISQFPGGEINFTTGTVVGGDNFTPYTSITPNNYYKYAVVLLTNDKILVVPPTGESANPNTAPTPPIKGGLLRGVVTVQDNGAGGIHNIEAEDIKRFFDTGAFVREYTVKRFNVTVIGGQSNFDVASQPDPFYFDPDNSILDIEVYVNGALKTQDTDGSFSGEYHKLSSTEIQFIDSSGNPLPVYENAEVVIKYKDTDIDTYTSGVAEGSWKFKESNEISNGSISDFSFTDINFQTDNDIFDVDIYVNNTYQIQKSNYIKIANDTIRFIDDDGTTPLPLHSGARVYAKQRQYSLGNVAEGSTFEGRDEGSKIIDNIGVVDAVGDFLEADSPSPGVYRLTSTAEENQAQNLGTAKEVVKGKNGHALTVRSIRGVDGIKAVYSPDNEEIWIGLATASFYRDYVTSVSGIVVPTPNIYDMGTNKLMPWRNGVRVGNTSLNSGFGGLIDRYQESSPNNISLYKQSYTSDVWTFLNENVAPIWVVILSNQTSTTLTVPSYLNGTNRIRAFRNGVLMNTAGKGAPEDRYSEPTTTTIELDEAALNTDWFLIEYMGEAPDFREDIDGITGNTVNITGSLTQGSDKELVFLNGVCIHNSTTLGNPKDRYQINTPTQLVLGDNIDLNDYVTVINKA